MQRFPSSAVTLKIVTQIRWRRLLFATWIAVGVLSPSVAVAAQHRHKHTRTSTKLSKHFRERNAYQRDERENVKHPNEGDRYVTGSPMPISKRVTDPTKPLNRKETKAPASRSFNLLAQQGGTALTLDSITANALFESLPIPGAYLHHNEKMDLPENLDGPSATQDTSGSNQAMQPKEVPERTKVVEPAPVFATLSGGMDTFVVSRPANQPLPVDPYAQIQAAMNHHSRRPPVVRDQFDGEITYSAASGLLPVAISLNGLMDGSQFATGISPDHLLGASALQNNSFHMSRNGEGIAVGGEAVPDAGAGIRLFKPVDGPQGVAGLGLYQRLGSTSFNLLPGIDTEIKSSPAHTTDLALAADSSLRLSQMSRMSGWTTSSFVGWSELNDAGEGSIGLSRQTKSYALGQQFGVEMGRTPGFSWNQSYSRKIGIADIALGSSILNESTGSQNLFSVSALRPFGRDLLSINAIQQNYKTSETSENNSQITTNLALPQKSGSLFLITDSLSIDSGAVKQSTQLSDGWQIGRGVNVQFGVNLGGSSNFGHLTTSVGVWVTPDWEARFNIGSTTDPTTGLTQTTLFGVQLVNRFNLTTYASGTVTGRVLLDGQSAAQPIRIQMDDRYVETDKQGNFVFTRAQIGPHEVGFDMTSLPATMDSVGDNQDINVEEGKTINVILKVQSIGAVRGKIIVAADAFGKIDPTAGAGLIITDGDGHETTSNPDDTFLLGDLPIGNHKIFVLPSSLPPGYIVAGPASTDVDVTGQKNIPELTINISPNEHIEMITLPSK